ncbi:MAG: glycosyltransferase family 2 protein [Flavobacteriales bacterium]|nr:glycosyltransferase family 2 protein [Flavobacteriales bacterium]HRH69744.1 glycosyltransferase family 2 protein [Flavobacteriales bacterium]
MIALSIIIPVFNGAASIERLVNELAKIRVDGGLELVLVNDCSPDDSWRIIQRLVQEAPMAIIAVDLARNFGEHNAVMAGYAVCSGQYVINIDDDFQNPPSEVVKLLDYAKAHPELDVIYTKYERKRHSYFRNLGSRFNDAVARLLLNKPKGLYLSSFRCVNRFLCNEILSYTGPYPYIDGIILEHTQHIGTLQVVHAPRAEGRSSYTLRKLIRLWLFMFVNFSVMPLRLSSIMGFVFSGSGFILALYVVFESVVLGNPQGWASITAGILVFSGIQLLMLGLIGEYLGRLYLMQKGKPQYAVRTVLKAEVG